jgi:hypothetical protein
MIIAPTLRFRVDRVTTRVVNRRKADAASRLGIADQSGGLVVTVALLRRMNLNEYG